MKPIITENYEPKAEIIGKINIPVRIYVDDGSDISELVKFRNLIKDIYPWKKYAALIDKAIKILEKEADDGKDRID